MQNDSNMSIKREAPRSQCSQALLFYLCECVSSIWMFKKVSVECWYDTLRAITCSPQMVQDASRICKLLYMLLSVTFYPIILGVVSYLCGIFALNVALNKGRKLRSLNCIKYFDRVMIRGVQPFTFL